MLRAMLNGVLLDMTQPALSSLDRGLLYGDGVFETMLLSAGRIRFSEDHWQRLADGCARLHIAMPLLSILQQELATLCAGLETGVVKLIVTRGIGARGYRPSEQGEPTRLWQLFAAPQPMTNVGIVLRWCATRLSRNALLAGVKHCNRLEQVLAQHEWRDPQIAEGLMLDTEDELVGGTMSNVFLVLDGVLVTPDLRYAGIAGVMRRNVLKAAQRLNMLYEARSVHADEVAMADELFVCNAVRGIQPARQLASQQWSVGAVTQRLQTELQQYS